MAFRNFRWNTLLHVISTISPIPCIFAGITIVVSYCLRAHRWNYFLPQKKNFTFGSRLFGIVIGYFFSNILPARLGDLIRPAYLSKINHQGMQLCLYSVVIERIWEIVLFLLFSAVFFYLSSAPLSQTLNINYTILIILFVAGIFFLLFLKTILNFCYDISLKFKLNFISNQIKRIIDAYDGNFKGNHFISIFFLTAIIFLVEGLTYAYLIESVGISISFVDKVMVMIITAFSIMLPSAPAAIGVFHYFCQFGLTLFGVEKDIALSTAILIHAYLFVFNFMFSMICMGFGHFNWKYFITRQYVDDVK